MSRKTAQPIDSSQRKHLRWTQGYIVRKHRGVDLWDVIDEKSGHVVHSALDAEGVRDVYYGRTDYSSVLDAVVVDPMIAHVLIAHVEKVARAREEVGMHERRLAAYLDEYPVPAETVDQMAEIAALAESLRMIEWEEKRR